MDKHSLISRFGSIALAAEALGVSYQAIRKLKDGKLPYSVIGRIWEKRPEVLIDYRKRSRAA